MCWKCPCPAGGKIFSRLTYFWVNVVIINIIAYILSLCVRCPVVEVGFYRNEGITKRYGRDEGEM